MRVSGQQSHGPIAPKKGKGLARTGGKTVLFDEGCVTATLLGGVLGSLYLSPIQ